MTMIPNKLDIEFLDFILSRRGQPTYSQPVPNSTIQKWQGVLPNRLLYFWQELGWCSFRNGLLWLVNPDDYTHLVADWVQDTRIEGVDTYHCYARTAFGELLLYAENSKRFLKIKPQYLAIWVVEKELLRPAKDGNNMIASTLFHDDKSYDMTDGNQQPMFARAVEKLGPLKPDEMYAFVPFMFLLPDEQITIDKLQRVRMDVQLSIIRQFDTPRLWGSSYNSRIQ